MLVSGGHTQIILVEDYLNMKIIGETRDDAVGEAFDKSAKILGLDYPGGPLLDKLAKNGNPLKYTFGKTKVPNLDFSFSGIKTSFLYFIDYPDKTTIFVLSGTPHSSNILFHSVSGFIRRVS